MFQNYLIEFKISNEKTQSAVIFFSLNDLETPSGEENVEVNLQAN